MSARDWFWLTFAAVGGRHGSASLGAPEREPAARGMLEAVWLVHMHTSRDRLPEEA